MGDEAGGRLDAWRTFLNAYRLVIDRLEQELAAERHLPLPWYDVLVQLAHAPRHRLTMNHLAGSVLLSPSGLTRLVDRLEDAGLVERQRCPEDRRKWFVVLTRKGLDTLRGATPVHLRGIDEHFARHLTDEEDAVLTRAFRKIIDALPAPDRAATGASPRF